jgi:F5/8 type C domain-containing protein/glycosyl hydrolase family 9/cellulase-like Ig domain-containing protein
MKSIPYPKSAFVLASVAMILFLPAAARAFETVSTVVEGGSLDTWSLSEMPGTQAEVGAVEEHGAQCLEVRFDMQRPDLNSRQLTTGLTLGLKHPDFIIKDGEALAFRLLWRGGRNSFRVELEDQDGRSRMYEVTDLDRISGWQDVVITPDQLENWGSKFVPGRLGRVRSLKLVVFFCWTAGPGSMLLDRVEIIKKPPARDPILGVSQLGYRPADPKFIVVRRESPARKSGAFRVIRLPDGDTVLSEKLERDPFRDWSGTFFRGDFSAVREPGRYQVEVSFDKKNWIRSDPFSIRDRVFDHETSRLVFDFLAGLRSDDPKIFGYSKLGGYRDTGTMLARYLNTNPQLVYGIACYVESANAPKSDLPQIHDALEALRYGVESMLAWQKSDGSVISAITRDPDIYPHNQNPEESTRPWKTIEGDMTATLAYPAAMAAAARALAPYDPELSAKALAAAKKTQAWASHRVKLKQTSPLGNQLWSSVEIYRMTKDPEDLKQGRELAAKLVARQFLDYSRTPDGICGNFSNSQRSPDFAFQYKVIHELGMYLGLIEILPLLDPSDSLYGDIHFFLEVFSRQYLLKMSSLTPYREIAEGLERHENGTFGVSYFHPPTGRLGVQGHGLNCDHLAYAFMGARLAMLLHNSDLEDFALNQLQWIFGVNPLGVSMMSGVGGRQGRSLDEYLGLKALPGGIMNGIVGHGGVDPYWALHWVSGEYWLPQNAFYLASIGSLEWPRAELAVANSPLRVRIEVPARVNGSEPANFKVFIENTSSSPVSTSIILRSRGAYAAEEKVPVQIDANDDLDITRELAPVGKCCPCLISVVVEGQVLAQSFFLPQFPAYRPPAANLKPIRPAAAEASSVQKNEKNVEASNAVDGELTTRWSSEFADPQWLRVDLGGVHSVAKVVIHWEAAYAESYTLEASRDGETWEKIYSVDDEDGGVDEIIVSKPVSARFLKLNCVRRGTPYGNAIFEFKIFGFDGSNAANNEQSIEKENNGEKEI